MRPNKTNVNRGEQDEQILRLRCAGLSLRAIGTRVGLSHQGVADRITAALAELVTPAAEEYRQLEAARLTDLTRAAYEVLDGAETGELKLRAVDRLTKLSESRRKLLGLDAVEPIAVTFERNLDDQGHIVVDALTAALEVLQLGEEQRQLAVAAAQAKLAGEPPPAPVAKAEPEGPDLMADFKAFAAREGFDPDDLDDEEDDGDGDER